MRKWSPRDVWAESQATLDDERRWVPCRECGWEFLLIDRINGYCKLCHRCEKAAIQARKAKKVNGVVYVAQSGRVGGNGRVKIGFTSGDPWRRIAELNTGNPYEIHLLFTLPGSLAREKQLHEEYKKHRIRGEWFAADVLEFGTLEEPWNEAYELYLREGEHALYPES